MSILQLANLHVNDANNKIQYNASTSKIETYAGNTLVITSNTNTMSVNGNVITNILTVQAKTDNYLLTAADSGTYITVNNTAAKTITIPTLLPVGFKCTVAKIGTGNVIISNAASVSLNSWTSNNSIVTRYATASIVSTDTNTFLIDGTLDTNPTSLRVEFTMIGGGGGGGASANINSWTGGGGGGAGGVVFGEINGSYDTTFIANTGYPYVIAAGYGGNGGFETTRPTGYGMGAGYNGQNSVFHTYTALGGGGGGPGLAYYSSNLINSGSSGGCGGGSGYSSTTPNWTGLGLQSAFTYFSSNGGVGTNPGGTYGSGGGGGITAKGGDGKAGYGGGDGGAGTVDSKLLEGYARAVFAWYGIGGGGGAGFIAGYAGVQGAGGSGGGASGQGSFAQASTVASGPGSGGGGGTRGGRTHGSNGYSGMVLLKIANTFTATGSAGNTFGSPGHVASVVGPAGYKYYIVFNDTYNSYPTLSTSYLNTVTFTYTG
jgi:hypothetical protein